MKTFLFSYGSNSPKQLKERLGHPVRARRGFLRDWRRIFVGHSERWGGAPATMVPSPGDVVYGTLVEVTPADLATLDRYEGAPRVYQRMLIEVESPDLFSPPKTFSTSAFVYLATSTKQGKPSAAYVKAIEQNLLSVWEPRQMHVRRQGFQVPEEQPMQRRKGAAAHAKSIRAAMGDEALAFARAEQEASPGAFWDEVVRVLDR